MAPQYSHPFYETVPACVLLHTTKKKLRMRLIQFSFNVCKTEKFGRGTGGGDSG